MPLEISISIGDLFWLFFMFSAIQPLLRQRMLEAMRVRKISQLEFERKSRVILFVHRQETMRLLGFPIASYIDINDAEDALRAIQMTDPDVPLDLVLRTPGGLVLAALQIAKAIREHEAKVTVFVPHYAMSGGTLSALAADEIVMCKHSVLGPIDSQFGQSPAASLIKVVEEKPVAKIDDQTLVLADIWRKTISQVRQAASELLDRRLPAEQAGALAGKLTAGTWTHDYPIWASTAKALGLPVTTEMPDGVLQLLKLYPQPVRMQNSGGVEYLPVRRTQSESPSSPAEKPKELGVCSYRGSHCRDDLFERLVVWTPGWLRCNQFGVADQVIGDQIEQEVGSDPSDAAMFGLAHGAVLLAPTEDALGHRPA